MRGRFCLGAILGGKLHPFVHHEIYRQIKVVFGVDSEGRVTLSFNIKNYHTGQRSYFRWAILVKEMPSLHILNLCRAGAIM